MVPPQPIVGTSAARRAGWLAPTSAFLVLGWSTYVFIRYFDHTFGKLGIGWSGLASDAVLRQSPSDYRITTVLGLAPLLEGSWRFRPEVAKAIGVTCLLVLLLIGAGRAVLRRLDLLSSANRRGMNSLALAIGLGILILVTAMLGFLRVLCVETLCGSLGVLAVYAIRSYRIDLVARYRSAGTDPGVGRLGWLQRAASVLVVAAVCAMTWPYAITSLAPEREFDSLNAYLYYARIFVEEGRIVDICPIRTHMSLYSILLCCVSLLLQGPAVVKLLTFVMAVASLRLVQCAAEQAGGRFGAGAWGAVVLLSVPAFTWTATVPYSDAQLAFFMLCAAVAAARWLETGRWAWAYVGAGFSGISAGLKYNGLALTALLLSILSLLWIVQRVRQRSRDPAIAGFPKLRFRAVAATLVVYLLAALSPYIRNYVWLGNPVFPFLYHAFPTNALTEREAARLASSHLNESMHFGTGWREQLRLPFRVTFEGYRIQSAIGPVFLMSIPLLLYIRRASLPTIFFLAFGLLSAWLWQRTSAIGRHFPISAALLALAFAVLLDHMRTSGRAGRLAGGMVATLWLLAAYLSLPAFARFWFGEWSLAVQEIPTNVVLGAQSEAEYLRPRVQGFETAVAINGLPITSKSRLAAIPPGRVEPFLVRGRPLDWDEFSPVFERPHDAQHTWRRLRDTGVEYLIWTYREPHAFRDWSILQPGSIFRSRYLERLFTVEGQTVFRIRPEPTDRSDETLDVSEAIMLGVAPLADHREPEYDNRRSTVGGRPTWGLVVRAGQPISVVLTARRVELLAELDDAATARGIRGSINLSLKGLSGRLVGSAEAAIPSTDGPPGEQHLVVTNDAATVEPLRITVSFRAYDGGTGPFHRVLLKRFDAVPGSPPASPAAVDDAVVGN